MALHERLVLAEEVVCSDLRGLPIADDDSNADASSGAGFCNLVRPERDDQIQGRDFEWDQ